jgi:hypothetical protein
VFIHTQEQKQAVVLILFLPPSHPKAVAEAALGVATHQQPADQAAVDRAMEPPHQGRLAHLVRDTRAATAQPALELAAVVVLARRVEITPPVALLEAAAMVFRIQSPAQPPITAAVVVVVVGEVLPILPVDLVDLVAVGRVQMVPARPRTALMELSTLEAVAGALVEEQAPTRRTAVMADLELSSLKSPLPLEQFSLVV